MLLKNITFKKKSIILPLISIIISPKGIILSNFSQNNTIVLQNITNFLKSNM